jgi:hypothetical protein
MLARWKRMKTVSSAIMEFGYHDALYPVLPAKSGIQPFTDAGPSTAYNNLPVRQPNARV